ncbi:hypothetical protein ACIGD1_15250 [Streptomyces sp. NPDC085612]|uniref:hypothetical protein n=1 Tax=Streptomyces sp. NPDC085612 TaxID=3365732 RepID=UPI0037CF5809
MSVPEAKALLTDRGTLAEHVTPERLAATRTNARTGAVMLAGDPALLPPDFPDTSWEDNWPRLDGWKRWLNVTGAGHAAFTDRPVLGDQVGYGHPETPLSGLRSQQITRGYVGAFFDLHLRGIAPRLEGPTAADPEVVFHRR